MHYFKLTYHTIQDEDEAHYTYQSEFLKAFGITEYDFKVIDEEMKDLYEGIKNDPVIRDYLEKYKGQYFTDNDEFILFQMFSYRHFSDFYPILKKSYNFTSSED